MGTEDIADLQPTADARTSGAGGTIPRSPHRCDRCETSFRNGHLRTLHRVGITLLKPWAYIVYVGASMVGLTGAFLVGVSAMGMAFAEMVIMSDPVLQTEPDENRETE